MANLLKTAALALVAPGLLASAMPAAADPYDGDGPGWSQGRDDDGWNHSRRHHRGDWNRRGWNGGGYDRSYDRGYGYGGYYGRSSYDEPVYRDTRVWRGNDGRYYCNHRDGTTGLLIGGVAGGVIGSQVAGRRGDQTLGVLLGAGIGALIGREIDKSDGRCR